MVDDAQETSDFWLWAEVVLAGCMTILLVDRVIMRDWIQVGLLLLLLSWQGRKALRAARTMAARRAS